MMFLILFSQCIKIYNYYLICVDQHQILFIILLFIPSIVILFLIILILVII
jgi:hypothetical protein